MSTFTTKSSKQRLDCLLVEAGYFPSREKARSAVMAGDVRRQDCILDKPGIQLYNLNGIHVRAHQPFVSRGGFKLQAALEQFPIPVAQCICLDIGASTGGFTDCLLQADAKKVYAIDVGYGQLDWKLRQDSRVICVEKTNVRYLKPEQLYSENQEYPTLAVMDVSFISILKILPALKGLLADDFSLVSLIKPQFEAGSKDNRKGIVTAPNIHLQVLNHIQIESAKEGFHLQAVIPSPIKGKTGNIEFLGWFLPSPPQLHPDLETTVNAAHAPS